MRTVAESIAALEVWRVEKESRHWDLQSPLSVGSLDNLDFQAQASNELDELGEFTTYAETVEEALSKLCEALGI